jgi:hypothetical protein
VIVRASVKAARRAARKIVTPTRSARPRKARPAKAPSPGAQEVTAMKLKVANGGAELAVSDENFGREYNAALVFQVVNAYRAAGAFGHQGAEDARRSARRRQEALAQKGTGSARAGSIRSPDLGRRRARVRGAAARFHAEGQSQDVSRRDPLDAL